MRGGSGPSWPCCTLSPENLEIGETRCPENPGLWNCRDGPDTKQLWPSGPQSKRRQPSAGALEAEALQRQKSKSCRSQFPHRPGAPVFGSWDFLSMVTYEDSGRAIMMPWSPVDPGAGAGFQSYLTSSGTHLPHQVKDRAANVEVWSFGSFGALALCEGGWEMAGKPLPSHSNSLFSPSLEMSSLCPREGKKASWCTSEEQRKSPEMVHTAFWHCPRAPPSAPASHGPCSFLLLPLTFYHCQAPSLHSHQFRTPKLMAQPTACQKLNGTQ